MAKKETFSEQLRQAIENSGLTRYQISKETGIHQSILGRFVHGEMGLAMETIDRLCEFLGLSISQQRKQRKKGK